MTVLLWIIGILFGVPLLLAIMPVRYRVFASVGGSGGTFAKATVGYFLHLLHVTIVYADKKTDYKICILGINATKLFMGKPENKSKTMKTSKTVKANKKHEENKRLQKEPFKISFGGVTSVLTHTDLKTIIGLIFEFFKKMIKNILPKRFDINSTVGFGDPFKTGVFIGAFDGISHVLNKHRHITVTGDFEKPSLKLTLNAKGSLSVMGMLAPVIRFLFKKPIFNLIIEYIKKNRKKNKKGDTDVRGSD